MCVFLFRCYDYDMNRLHGHRSEEVRFSEEEFQLLLFSNLITYSTYNFFAMEQMKGNTDKEDNADWILDSLVAYLRGPIWITPILNFMEQKSVGMIILHNNMFISHLPV